jgi:hypothetical protein
MLRATARLARHGRPDAGEPDGSRLHRRRRRAALAKSSAADAAATIGR